MNHDSINLSFYISYTWTNCLHIQCKSGKTCQCTVRFTIKQDGIIIITKRWITLPIPRLQKSTMMYWAVLFKTWYMWNIKCMEYQIYWIYFLHKLYSVQVELVVLPTPPLQKSTMMSPGRWIASTAVARFSSCWHFLWWRFFGRSTNVYIQLSKKKLFFRRWICKNEEYFSIHFAWMFVALQHLKSP